MRSTPTLQAIFLLSMMLTTCVCYGARAAETAAAAHPPSAAAGGQLPVGAVPSLPVVTLDNRKMDLTSVTGFKVIYFFSAGCPCVRSCEQISFKPLAQQYAGKVSFFAVTSGNWDLHDDHANFLDLVATHHLPFPVVLDPNHRVADTLGGRAASQVILLTPDNHVIYSGQADDSKDYLETNGKVGATKFYLADAIAAALAGKPVPVSYTAPKGCSISR